MNRNEKAAIVADVRERLARLPNVYLTDFTGLKVKQVTDLRRRLRQAGLEYVVVKNTLAQRALADAGVGGFDAGLAGPTGWVFAAEPVAAAKIITEFQKDAESFHVKAGLVEGRALTAEEVTKLAKLPSRTELLGQLAAQVVGGALLGTWVSVIAVDMHIGSVCHGELLHSNGPHSGEEYCYGSETLCRQSAL